MDYNKISELRTINPPNSIEVDYNTLKTNSYNLFPFEYMEHLPENENPKNLTSIGDYISEKGLKQLRIAETEKYAHVTFFFDGGVDKEIEGATRVLINSPKVATYDLQPEMSAYEVTNKVIKAIESRKYNTIILNYANPDMVGHTGNLELLLIMVIVNSY